MSGPITFPPRVHVAPHGLAHGTFVEVESHDDDDLRGGRLTLSLSALRALPAQIDRAIREYEERLKSA